MTNLILKNLVRLIFLLLLQVLVFNHIVVDSYLIPHIYILFILLLPFESPQWLVLILSFLVGLVVDMFSYTVGLHTVACTLTGFLRTGVQNMIAAKQEYEPGIQPGISRLGLRWFFSYTVILVSIHHIVIYLLEEFSTRDILLTLYHALLNILLTSLIIILAQVLFSGIKK